MKKPGVQTPGLFCLPFNEADPRHAWMSETGQAAAAAGPRRLPAAPRQRPPRPARQARSVRWPHLPAARRGRFRRWPRTHQGSRQRLRLGRRTHHPHLAQREQCRMRHTPQGQCDQHERAVAGQPDTGQHAQRQHRAEHQGRAQRRTIDPAPTQCIADQPDSSEAHQPPTHLCRRYLHQPLQHIGQVGIGSKHRGEHQHGQQHIAQQLRLAQHSCLFAQRAPRSGHGVRHPHRQRAGHQQRQGRQQPEAAAPTEGVGGQRTQWDTEQHCGGDTQ